MVLRLIATMLVLLTLSACADDSGLPILPLEGTLHGPCAPAFVRASWSF